MFTALLAWTAVYLLEVQYDIGYKIYNSMKYVPKLKVISESSNQFVTECGFLFTFNSALEETSKNKDECLYGAALV